MSNFTLEILPDNPEQIAHSRERIKQEIEIFKGIYLADNPEKINDPRIKSLFKDLNSGRYWGALTLIDGHSDDKHPFFYYPDHKSPNIQRKERHEARAWARRSFNDAGLEKILNICTNTALLTPFGTLAGQA